MNRNMERRIVMILGCWQLIDGVITIIFFNMYKKEQYSHLITNEVALDTILGNVSLFITSFGILLIALGLLNLVISKNYIKDGQVNKKIGVWLIFIGIISYFSMDFLSVALSVTSAIILLSKNKSIKAQKTYQ